MGDSSTDSSPGNAEFIELSRKLQELDAQLQALTSGEVDAVISPSGQSWLLQKAQTALLLAEGEQRGLAQQLQIERSKLLAAQAVAKIGSWSFEVATAGIEWSQEMHRIWHTDPTQFHPDCERILQLIHPEDRDAVDAAFMRSLEGSSDNVLEHRLLLSGGLIKYVEERWQMERDERGIVVRALGTCQDISERRQADQALRESQSLLSMASRLGRIGAWSMELSRTHVVWSDEVCAIHEEPPGTSPSLQKAIDYYAPEYREAMSRAAQICAQDGTPFDLELEIVTARNRRIWVRAIGEAVRDPDGAIRIIQGALQDLSDRKLAELQTRRLATRLATTLESLTIGFYIVDREWRFTFLNAQAEQMLGRRREDLVGQILWDVLPEFAGTPFEEGYRRAMTESHSTLTEGQLAPHEPWLRATAYPSEEGLAVYLRDITADRAGHEQLRLLEASVARINDMLVIVAASPGNDTLTNVIFVNDAFVDFTGYSRDEIIGQSRQILYGPDTDRRELARVVNALAHFEPVHAEMVHYKKNGEPYWVELDIVPVAAQGTSYTHFVGVERDITQRRRDQQALRELNSELEARVQTRTLALNAALSKAEQATRAKSTFLATVSHELRTPMNGVLGLIEVLSRATLPASQREMVDLIRSSADSLLNIIDDILDFSKMEAGKLRLVHAPLRLAETVEKVCGLLDSFAASRNVQLTCYVDPRIPMRVAGDELRLRQVLFNLIGNALKFSSGLDRPGRVGVRGELIDAGTNVAKIDLIVTDNGIGIDQETLSRLFVPFSQADDSTTRRFGGTGLGLVITQMLVQLMGGEISVQSVPGEGSVFRIRLPFEILPDAAEIPVERLPLDAGGAERDSQSRSHIPPNSRILVAEDNATNREVIRQQLQLLGVSAELAVDGEQALQLWRSGEFTLLLTDLRMPKMDGYQLVAAIRAEEPPGRRARIIALTANALPEEEAHCREAGIDGYLVKPVKLQRLKSAISQWLAPSASTAAGVERDPAPVAGEAEAPADLSVLRSLVGDEPADVQAVIESFRVSSARIGVELNAAILAGALKTAGDLAHKLKSGAFSIGASRLGGLCIALEIAALAGDAPAVAGLWPTFRSQLDLVDAFLQREQRSS